MYGWKEKTNFYYNLFKESLFVFKIKYLILKLFEFAQCAQNHFTIIITQYE